MMGFFTEEQSESQWHIDYRHVNDGQVLPIQQRSDFLNSSVISSSPGKHLLVVVQRPRMEFLPQLRDRGEDLTVPTLACQIDIFYFRVNSIGCVQGPGGVSEVITNYPDQKIDNKFVAQTILSLIKNFITFRLMWNSFTLLLSVTSHQKSSL